MPVLEMVSGPFPGTVYPVRQEEVFIGRAPGCGVMVDDQRISRQHARLIRAGEIYQVEDLGSSNGTFVNGQVVEESTPLLDGDEIQLHKIRFVYREAAPEIDERPSEITGSIQVDSRTSGIRLQSDEKLNAIMEISARLAKSVSLDDVLYGILDALFGVFPQAERGFILLPEDESEDVHIRAKKLRPGQQDATGARSVSQSVCKQVMDCSTAVLSVDASSDPRFASSTSMVDLEIRSMMCAPLLGANNESHGIIQIDRKSGADAFSMQDLELLATVGTIAGQALENRRLYADYVTKTLQDQELQLAAEVQQHLLPKSNPRPPGYDVHHYYESARELGGDYYDWIALSDDRVAFAVGDVTGKGVAAALLMARLNAAVRFCCSDVIEPVGIVQMLNDFLCRHPATENRFVTMLFAVLNPREHTLTIIRAGHPCPLLRRNGEVIPLLEDESGGLPLGIDADFQYQQQSVALEPGDAVVFYTDGLSEAKNIEGELYEAERLSTAAVKAPTSAQEMTEFLLDDVRDHSVDGMLTDDLCLLSIVRMPTD